MKTRKWNTLRRILLAMAVGTAFFPMEAQAATKTKPITSAYAGAVCTKGGCSTADDDTASVGDRKLGTAINWMSSPDAAGRAAVDEGKLVFMIQVSGNFARQEFT